MDIFQVKNEDGTMENVPCVQFEISKIQQIMVIAVDFERRKDIKVMGGFPDIDTQLIGKLEQQNTILEIQITNSLAKYQWDFEKYPNPEIILITDKRILN